MRALEREINGFMKLDCGDLADQMNNAFEGKKYEHLIIPKD
jgi:hypothetical protein